MNKHTPQEWADWTGCYVVQSKEGGWYLLNRKPKVAGNTWIGNGEYAIRIDESVISVSANHDWTTLYEPQKQNPDHSSEVFIHKEYQLVYSDTPAGLSDAVTKLIGRGWSLYGSPFAMPYGAEFYHYQAMVRGL